MAGADPTIGADSALHRIVETIDAIESTRRCATTGRGPGSPHGWARPAITQMTMPPVALMIEPTR